MRKIMSAKTSESRLRAIVTQVDDELIVSICVVAPQEAPLLVDEKIVADLDAAHAFIEQLARQIGFTAENVHTIYNLDEVQ
jgi:hypothetical protein